MTRKMNLWLALSLGVLIAPGAQAAITLGSNGQLMGAVVFAKETLLSGDANTHVVGDMPYYLVTGAADALNVTGTTGVGTASGDDLSVRVTLQGMRFSSAAPTLTVAGSETIQRVSGGDEGDLEALFAVTAGTSGIATDAALTVAISSLLLPSTGSGSVTIRSSYELAGEVLSDSTRFPGAVSVAPSLVETVEPMSATTQVSDMFRSFKPAPPAAGKLYKAMLGSLQIGVKGGAIADDNYQDANDGADVDGLDDIMADPTAAESESTVTVTGDFSFAETVRWTDNAAVPDCPDVPAGTEARKPLVDANNTPQTDDEGNTIYNGSELAAKPVNDFGGTNAVALCIYVDDEDEDLRIPETMYYMATIAYEKIDDHAFAPESTGPFSLGRIMRDGATVIIPYITTVEGKNQRLTMSNRGSMDALYEFMFRPEMGTMAAPGMYAEGTLGAGETMTLNARDVVTLSGDSRRTAATVSFVAQGAHIDVTSTITNRATGAQSMETHSKN